VIHFQARAWLGPSERDANSAGEFATGHYMRSSANTYQLNLKLLPFDPESSKTESLDPDLGWPHTIVVRIVICVPPAESKVVRFGDQRCSSLYLARDCIVILGLLCSFHYHHYRLIERGQVHSGRLYS